jgi:uncharacterized protein (TIGR02453 family)
MKGPANTANRVRFEGWPKPALQFFHGLERDNSKAYFEAHRTVYEDLVRQPMEALVAELERDLGPDVEVKIFRLNRDLRFSPDKRPYKEHLGAYLSNTRAGGLYLQISNDGLYMAIGAHEMAADQLTRFRDAVAGREGESWLGSSRRFRRTDTRSPSRASSACRPDTPPITLVASYCGVKG